MSLFPRFSVDVDGVEETRARFPDSRRVVNQELNRGFLSIGGAFFRRANREKRVRVQRQGRAQRRGRSKVSIPKEMRALGFYGNVGPLGEVDGKEFRGGTSAPSTVKQEVGGVIRARDPRGLFVRKPRGRRWRRGGEVHGEIVAVKQAIHFSRRLNFMRSFRGFRGETRARLRKIWDRVDRRI